MLRIDELRVAYDGVPAVHGISLHVDRGEIVSLVGPNGAGKSSTLMAVFGVVRPVGGSVAFDGRPLAGLAPEQVARTGLALVPEGRHIFAGLSVADNLHLGAIPRPDSADMADAVERVLELFPVLKTRYRSQAAVLSGGEQQQLAIGRALMADPRLILLDEPSLGLAPQVIEQVFETLLKLRDSGVTILLVEQNALQAVELSDRAYVLRTGRIAMAGSRDELLGNPQFESAFLGF
jgi:branched-chain amino acid transport system ATP-binding protein